jgi:hypothetical protein
MNVVTRGETNNARLATASLLLAVGICANPLSLAAFFDPNGRIQGTRIVAAIVAGEIACLIAGAWLVARAPRLQLGEALLQDGRNEEANEELERVRGRLAGQENPDPKEVAAVRDLLATAYLRLGERQNCVMHHGIDSCLMPIRGSGVHSEPYGSERAIPFLSEALEENPDDLGSRWLLNLAYMTLGKYPEQVPQEHLIPPSAFDSEHDMPRFYDVSHALGLDVFGLAGGCILEDFDADGYLDLMVSNMDLRGSRSGRTVRRAEHLPHRLQQRRVPRRVHPARRLAGAERAHAQLAPEEQRRRHLHRRDRGSRHPELPSQADRGLGRLRQRRLARRVHRERVGAAQPQPPVRALPQQPRRDLHRGGPRDGAPRGLREGRGLG